MTTATQNRQIHSIRARIPHFEESDYRALLVRVTGKSSSKLLDQDEAERVIKELRLAAGQQAGAPLGVRRASRTAEGPYARKLQALWISLYNLGAVDNRDDAAMMKFVERQTGLSHTRFLQDAAEARKAVEALKDMLARHCRTYGVELPAKDQSDRFIDTKRAICKAIAFRACTLGAFDLFTTFQQDWPAQFERYAYALGGFPASFEFYGAAHWDKLARALARKTRVHLTKKPKKQRSAA
jgi:hypothetical protein